MKILPVLITVMIVQSVCSQTRALPKTGTSLSQFTVINTGTSDQLTSISKINNNILISGFSSYLAKSYDDCNTLIPVNTPVFMEAPQNRYYSTLRMDTNVIFMSYKTTSSNWKFYKSIDGGNNWVKKQDSTHANLFFVEPTLLFFDTSNAVIVFDYNRTIRTTNGLTTYTVDWVVNGAGYFIFRNSPGVVFGDSTAIVGETMYGGAYITKNRGKAWQSVGVVGATRDFEAMNKDTIFHISSPATFDTDAYFGYSFDGGLNWINKSISKPTYFLNVCVKNINEIYLLAREGASATGNGVILKTTNLGQTWKQLVTPYLADLRDMKFLNEHRSCLWRWWLAV